MKIIFVRHGQTEFNILSRYQGHTDSKLSELGRLQAEQVGERLKDEKITAVYSSDLSRAFDTACAIAQRHGLSVSVDARLRECSFGEWEGLSVTEIAERYPVLYRNYLMDSVSYRAPNGERLEALKERVVEAMEEIIQRHREHTVVVVVHIGPIRAFLSHVLAMPFQSFRRINLSNGSITTLSFGPYGGWFLETLNDTFHLARV